MRLLAQSLGVLGILFIVTGYLTQLPVKNSKPVAGGPDSKCTLPPDGFPGGFKGPVIALEFAGSVCDIEGILGGDEHQNRKDIRSALGFDTYFIIAYWLFFVVMGVVLTQRGLQWVTWIGVAAILGGTGAAIFDFIENSRIRKVLDTPLAQTTSEMALNIRAATLWKWGLSFLTVLLLAATFFFLRDVGSRAAHWIALLTGISFAAAALLGFVGLRYNRLIPLTTLIQLPGLLGLIIISFKWPEAFLDKL